MKISLINYITLFALLLLISLSAFLSYKVQRQPKIAYIDINEVYEAFDAKTEREIELEILLNKQKEVLDTLEKEIVGLYDKYELLKSKELENEIILKERNYDRVNEEFKKISTEARNRFLEEVMKQLNDNIAKFGEEKKVDILYGANGNGSIMYANDKYNLTQEAIVFINKTYADE